MSIRDFFESILEYIVDNSAAIKNILTSIPVLGAIFIGIFAFIAKVFRMIFPRKDNSGIETFSEDTDGEFISHLTKRIKSASDHMVFIGLGHTLLRHNDKLRREIVSSLKSKKNLRLEVYYSEMNDGVKNRIIEERRHYADLNMNYDDGWLTDFYDNAVDFFSKNLSRDEVDRSGIFRLKYMPMYYLISIDGDYYFYMYGAPNRKGPEAPWFFCRKDDVQQEVLDHFKQEVSFAQRFRGENGLTGRLASVS